MQFINNVSGRSINKNNTIIDIFWNKYTTHQLALLLTDNTFTSLDGYFQYFIYNQSEIKMELFGI